MEAGGKPGVRRQTGDPVSSPEAAFSEIPLCPGGCSLEAHPREARWLRVSRGRERSSEPSPSLLIFGLTSFSASSGGSGSRQWIRRAAGHVQEGAGAAA